MSQPDLNAALIFIKVVQSGSFRQAARELGMQKTTVSRKVSELEDRLGSQLLMRSTRSMSLTDSGQVYLRQAQSALALLDEAERVVSELQSQPRGRLRIALCFDIGLTLLPRLLQGFQERFPHIQLEVDLSDQMVNLIQNDLDVAIHIGTPPDSSLIALRLGEASSHLFASPDYLDAKGEPRTLADLLAHDCLLHTSQTESSWTFQGEKGPLVVSVTPRLSSNSFLLLRRAAEMGMGLALLPGHVGDEAVREGLLLRVLGHYRLATLPIHLLYPSMRLRSPKIRAFVEFMKMRAPIYVQNQEP